MKRKQFPKERRLLRVQVEGVISVTWSSRNTTENNTVKNKREHYSAMYLYIVLTF